MGRFAGEWLSGLLVVTTEFRHIVTTPKTCCQDSSSKDRLTVPELPEVETMRRGILPIVGSRIIGVQRPRCRLKPIAVSPAMATFRRRTIGQRIDDVQRIGKRVIVRLTSDDAIVFEPRMTGLVLLADPPNLQHLRFQLDLADADHDRLLFWDRRGLGNVTLLSPEELAVRIQEKLGPDALTVDGSMLRQRLGASQRAIKVALLDQHAVAGIGNLYASEILFLAKVHPQKRCHSLTRKHWDAIAERIVEVLNEAIRYEGSTLSDGTYRNALNKEGGYQNHHRVYDRENLPCPQCRSPIVRIVQSQRSTFFCAKCQRRPRST